MKQLLKKSNQIKIHQSHNQDFNIAVKLIMKPMVNNFDFWDRLREILCIDEELNEKINCSFSDNIFGNNPISRDLSLKGILSPNAPNDKFEDSIDWLGSYESISSPGKIRLNITTLQYFFYAILRKLILEKKHKIDFEDFENLANLVIYKTYFHELFHHFSDVYGCNRQGKGTNYSPMGRRNQKHWVYEKEEALAVAASRHITGLFASATPLLTDFFEFSYKYTSVGYKDWTDYQAYPNFRKGIKDYFIVETKLLEPGFDYLDDMFEHQFVSLINNPFAILVLA